MKKLFILSLLMATSSLLYGQVVVTLMLPDPCFSNTGVTFRPLVFQDVSMYPNPTTDMLTIDIERTGASQPVFVEVYNILGLRMMTVHHPGNETIILDLSDNPPGIYFISLTSGNFSVHKKIIKL